MNCSNPGPIDGFSEVSSWHIIAAFKDMASLIFYITHQSNPNRKRVNSSKYAGNYLKQSMLATGYKAVHP